MDDSFGLCVRMSHACHLCILTSPDGKMRWIFYLQHGFDLAEYLAAKQWLQDKLQVPNLVLFYQGIRQVSPGELRDHYFCVQNIEARVVCRSGFRILRLACQHLLAGRCDAASGCSQRLSLLWLLFGDLEKDHPEDAHFVRGLLQLRLDLVARVGLEDVSDSLALVAAFSLLDAIPLHPRPDLHLYHKLFGFCGFQNRDVQSQISLAGFRIFSFQCRDIASLERFLAPYALHSFVAEEDLPRLALSFARVRGLYCDDGLETDVVCFVDNA